MPSPTDANPGRIKLFDTNNGKFLRAFSTNSEEQTAWLASFDNGFLAAMSLTNKISVVDTNTGDVKYKYDQDAEFMPLTINMMTSYHGNFLIRGGIDGEILVWDVTGTGKLKYRLNETNGGYAEMSWANVLEPLENGYFATSNYAKEVKVWDFVSGKLKYTLKKPGDVLRGLKNGNMASISKDDSVLDILEVESGKLINTFNYNDKVLSFAPSCENDLLVGFVKYSTLKVWDLSNNQIVLKHSLKLNNPVQSSTPYFSCLGNNYLAVATDAIYIYDLDKGALVETIKNDDNGDIAGLRSLKNGLLVSYEFLEGSSSIKELIKVWDLSNK